MSVLREERVEGVRVLTLDRPEKANAMNAAMHDALVAALGAGEAPLVIAASGGRVFSAGADLKEFSELASAEAARRRRALLARTLYAMLECPAPVVAAVEGKALGAGCMLALLADEVVMAPGAEQGLPEIRHGIPTPVGYEIVAARAGAAVARRMVQGGEPIAAPACVSLGLADAVEGNARAAAIARAQALPAGPAFAANKKYVNTGLRRALEGAFAAAGGT